MQYIIFLDYRFRLSNWLTISANQRASNSILARECQSSAGSHSEWLCDRRSKDSRIQGFKDSRILLRSK